jgi:5-hydroxyisourate hydrolase
MSGPINRLSAHVLDTSLGRPAARIPAVLTGVTPTGAAEELGHGATDEDGRIQQLNAADLAPGE